MKTDENSKLHPSSVYGFTKLAQEQLSLIVTESLDISTLIYRFQNVYGPGQSLKNPYTGILSIFFNINQKIIKVLTSLKMEKNHVILYILMM